MTDSIELGCPGDFHVHLRDGDMKNLVTPTIREGGVSVVYVMPNLVPPLIDPEVVLEYKKSLQKLSPKTTFLMSLYLSPKITPEVVEQAKKAGITGIKCYPAGVTTNSDHGVSSYEPFYPTFAAMEKHNMILNLHGECPSGHGIHVLNAEEKFLPTLKDLHQRFPKLRIILEHCTSEAAINAVLECGDNVAATITAHHLYLIVDNWGGNAHNFCKPVAKLPADRDALIKAATSGNPKFFFGSDSAPHPVKNKAKASGAAAGVFTQAYAIPYVAEVFEQVGKLDYLKGFVTDFGKKFYGISDDDLVDKSTVTLVKSTQVVETSLTSAALTDGDAVIPFRAGEKLKWSVTWS
ncbi:dihydroorotase [Sugiyamaella lignohabitans]|uniref:dihydroorotase n=1 Tax=Sugiyamaella lignohabitans TaxID=796027 RepID=A0A167DHK6_9ASCO|nr:dihydroorotase [Sugiyamaella lignohabitans]ANB12930.1 dihydroorotase [Sugiyamaella lignohabitans]